jgi:hypothetical protein
VFSSVHLGRRAWPNCMLSQSQCPCLTVAIYSHIVMVDIGMMDIYCPSKLISRFPTTIDGIIMFISGLGLALGSIYTSFKQRSQIHFILTLKIFVSPLTNLSIKAPVSTKHPSHFNICLKTLPHISYNLQSYETHF